MGFINDFNTLNLDKSNFLTTEAFESHEYEIQIQKFYETKNTEQLI